MHPCPRCGESTDGAYSEGELRWAICSRCMAEEHDRDPVTEYEEREARIAFARGEWFNDDLSI